MVCSRNTGVPAGWSVVIDADNVATVVAPAVVRYVGRRAAQHIDADVGSRHERLDQRALAGADFAEKAKMNTAGRAARRQVLQLGLSLGNVDAGLLGIRQPLADVLRRQRPGIGLADIGDLASDDEPPD